MLPKNELQFSWTTRVITYAKALTMLMTIQGKVHFTHLFGFCPSDFRSSKNPLEIPRAPYDDTPRHSLNSAPHPPLHWVSRIYVQQSQLIASRTGAWSRRRTVEKFDILEFQHLRKKSRKQMKTVQQGPIRNTCWSFWSTNRTFTWWRHLTTSTPSHP